MFTGELQTRQVYRVYQGTCIYTFLRIDPVAPRRYYPAQGSFSLDPGRSTTIFLDVSPANGDRTLPRSTSAPLERGWMSGVRAAGSKVGD